ncbi:MAG: hypothetical protein Q9226_008545, partial [Calogaya cf. arnoldii]
GLLDPTLVEKPEIVRWWKGIKGCVGDVEAAKTNVCWNHDVLEAFATLVTSLVHYWIIARVFWIEPGGKLLALHDFMTAAPVEVVCRPIVKGLIDEMDAISL